jgi:hypothetical protein
VADKAGGGGDKPRYQAWLWAADAAMQLLAMTVTKTSRTRNIALTVRYTSQKLTETDWRHTEALLVAASTASVMTDVARERV